MVGDHYFRRVSELLRADVRKQISFVRLSKRKTKQWSDFDRKDKECEFL